MDDGRGACLLAKGTTPTLLSNPRRELWHSVGAVTGWGISEPDCMTSPRGAKMLVCFLCAPRLAGITTSDTSESQRDPCRLRSSGSLMFQV
jgi:hypothetical protein